jgi:hypothetical protein
MAENRTIPLFNDRIKLFGNAILVPKTAIFLRSLIEPIKTMINLFAHQHQSYAIHPQAHFSLDLCPFRAAMQFRKPAEISIGAHDSSLENRMKKSEFVGLASNR